MTAFICRDRLTVLGTFTTREQAVKLADQHRGFPREINRIHVSWIQWVLLKVKGR